jgi:hypothetical protein
MDSYRRKFHVTEHALQRVRERLTDKQKSAFRHDGDLGNALDQAVADAINQEAYEHITDDNVPTLIVDLGQSSDFSGMWALVKPEARAKRGEPDRFISTCLTTEQVLRNKADAGRNWGHKTSATSKLGSLKDALAPIAAAIKDPPKPPPVKTVAPVPEPPRPVSQIAISDPSLVLGLDLEKRLVIFKDGRKEVVPRQKAAEAVAAHISGGGDRDDIRVFKQGWVEVEKKVRMEVEVEV